MSSITLTLDLPLSHDDLAVLASLIGVSPAKLTEAGPAEAELAKSAEDEPAEPPKKKRGRPTKAEAEAKAEAAKAAEAEPTEAKPDEPTEAKPASSDDASRMDEAVTRASELLSQGRAGDVKAALGDLGVSRVSQLKPAQIDEFLAALS